MIKSLAHEIEKQTPKPKLKTLFKQSENLKLMLENQITVNIGTKLNNFAELLGLNSFGSDGKVIKKLLPISKKEIRAIMIILPTIKCLFRC